MKISNILIIILIFEFKLLSLSPTTLRRQAWLLCEARSIHSPRHDVLLRRRQVHGLSAVALRSSPSFSLSLSLSLSIYIYIHMCVIAMQV